MELRFTLPEHANLKVTARKADTDDQWWVDTAKDVVIDGLSFDDLISLRDTIITRISEYRDSIKRL